MIYSKKTAIFKNVFSRTIIKSVQREFRTSRAHAAEVLCINTLNQYQHVWDCSPQCSYCIS